MRFGGPSVTFLLGSEDDVRGFVVSERGSALGGS